MPSLITLLYTEVIFLYSGLPIPGKKDKKKEKEVKDRSATPTTETAKSKHKGEQVHERPRDRVFKMLLYSLPLGTNFSFTP